MVWYTPQFRPTFWSPEDMMVFIDLIFAVANQGFINSKITVRFPLYVPYSYFSATYLSQVRAVKYNVKQHPTLNDKQNGVNLFQSFENSMTLAELHNCADVTTVFIEDFDYYGLSNTNSDRTFDCRINQSIIPKSSTSYRFIHYFHHFKCICYHFQFWA